MSDFSIMEIDHLVLRVSDLERSLRFYCDVLGCPVDRRRDDLGMVHLRAGRSLIDLVAVEGPLGQKGGPAPGREGHNLDHLCLRVEPFDAQALQAYLQTAGVEVEAAQKRYGAQGEGLSVYCYDPDGNLVELKGPPLLE